MYRNKFFVVWPTEIARYEPAVNTPRSIAVDPIGLPVWSIVNVRFLNSFYSFITHQDRRGQDSAASPVAGTSVRACLRNREIGRRSRDRRTTTTTKVVSITNNDLC